MKTAVDIGYFSLLMALYLFICALLGMEAYAYKAKMKDLKDSDNEIPVPLT